MQSIRHARCTLMYSTNTLLAVTVNILWHAMSFVKPTYCITITYKYPTAVSHKKVAQLIL